MYHGNPYTVTWVESSTLPPVGSIRRESAGTGPICSSVGTQVALHSLVTHDPEAPQLSHVSYCPHCCCVVHGEPHPRSSVDRQAWLRHTCPFGHAQPEGSSPLSATDASVDFASCSLTVETWPPHAASQRPPATGMRHRIREAQTVIPRGYHRPRWARAGFWASGIGASLQNLKTSAEKWTAWGS